MPAAHGGQNKLRICTGNAYDDGTLPGKPKFADSGAGRSEELDCSVTLPVNHVA